MWKRKEGRKEGRVRAAGGSSFEPDVSSRWSGFCGDLRVVPSAAPGSDHVPGYLRRLVHREPGQVTKTALEHTTVDEIDHRTHGCLSVQSTKLPSRLRTVENRRSAVAGWLRCDGELSDPTKNSSLARQLPPNIIDRQRPPPPARRLLRRRPQKRDSYRPAYLGTIVSQQRPDTPLARP